MKFKLIESWHVPDSGCLSPSSTKCRSDQRCFPHYIPRQSIDVVVLLKENCSTPCERERVNFRMFGANVNAIDRNRSPLACESTSKALIVNLTRVWYKVALWEIND